MRPLSHSTACQSGHTARCRCVSGCRSLSLAPERARLGRGGLASAFGRVEYGRRWLGAVLAEGQKVVASGVVVVFLQALNEGVHADVQTALQLHTRARQFPSLMPTGRIQVSIAIELVASCAGSTWARGLKVLQDSISHQNTLRADRGARPHAPQALPEPRSRNIRPETCFGPFSLSPRQRKNGGCIGGSAGSRPIAGGVAVTAMTAMLRKPM